MSEIERTDPGEIEVRHVPMNEYALPYGHPLRRDEAEDMEELREQLRVAVEALERIAGVYERTMPGPRDAQRDRVLEIIAAYRAAAGGQ